jgi:hypothetical protein
MATDTVSVSLSDHVKADESHLIVATKQWTHNNAADAGFVAVNLIQELTSKCR